MSSLITIPDRHTPYTYFEGNWLCAQVAGMRKWMGLDVWRRAWKEAATAMAECLQGFFPSTSRCPEQAESGYLSLHPLGGCSERMQGPGEQCAPAFQLHGPIEDDEIACRHNAGCHSMRRAADKCDNRPPSSLT